MKIKKLTALLLALCITFSMGVPARAFSDISRADESSAAESLRSLSIVSSVENFNPNSYLTRAEFCKMATLSAGFNEISAYSSYTLYPDVESWRWYAPYINASIGKYKMIQGYPDGYFRPSDTITYGMAVTILLRQLGYKTEDIGAFWPRDYVNKASAIGLSKGIDYIGENSPLPRGQAAILLRNLLLTNTKDGAQFITTGFSVGKESILCATDSTDPSLDKDKLTFADTSSYEKSTIANPGTISPNLVGVRGTTVYSKTDSSKLVGFIADIRTPQTVTVKTTTAEYIETETGKITIPRTAKAFVFGDIADYTVCWYDIKAGAKVDIYTDTHGNINFISAKQTSSLTGTFVYGVDNDAIPTNANIIMNGSKIAVAQLEKYDVVSYSPNEQTYYVSNNRISALYESSGPTYTNPTYIVASGQKYAISEKAAKYFKDLSFNKVITLLFDSSGNIAAAYPGASVQGSSLGILTDLGSPSAVKAEVSMLNGTSLKGDPDLSAVETIIVNQQSVSALFKSEGNLVTAVPTSDKKLRITPVTYSSSLAGKYDKKANKLGSNELSPQVQIYERPALGMPLRKISVSDLPDTMSSSRTLHATKDRSGKIDLLILDNITGDGFKYGLIKQTSEDVVVDYGIDGTTSTRTEYTLTFRTSTGVTTEKSYYSATGISYDVVPGAIGTGLETLGVKFTSTGNALKSSGVVSRDAFDSVRGVRFGNLYVPVSKDVQVYNKSLDRFMGLQEARANFTSFELFCDSDPVSGGKVRIIIAK